MNVKISRSWRTTILGALIVLVAVYNSVSTGEPVNMTSLIALLTGAGLLVARDQKD